MSPDSTEIEEPGVDELERAMRAAGVPQVSHVPHAPHVAQALPLDYASRHTGLRDAIDWGNCIRQVVFAAGVGFIAGAAIDVWGSNPWTDNQVLWVGFGAAMVALTLPWPGRIGRRRT